MSTPFYNRLVGTVIVAAVAIIFLPDILDGEKKTYQSEFESIPQAPAVETGTNNKTFPQEKLNSLAKQESVVDEVALDVDNTSSNNNTEDDTQSRVNNNSDKVKVSAVSKPEVFDDSKTKSKQESASSNSTAKKTLPEKAVSSQAWVIQLGSFKHKKNVETLVNKLKSNGYTAFTKPIKTKNGTLTKVFVGPELIKSSLEKKIPKLKALTNVDGKVARFYPTK
ncbi:SPOR domain-containing protein [Thalassotalea sp. PLHSN55]|uniref:SPOR domain-containing protein n=1 Tax=Thalassotalea sp. PLHSN55 TaxID=3435888 RepID=UPI003F879559